MHRTCMKFHAENDELFCTVYNSRYAMEGEVTEEDTHLVNMHVGQSQTMRGLMLLSSC